MEDGAIRHAGRWIRRTRWEDQHARRKDEKNLRDRQQGFNYTSYNLACYQLISPNNERCWTYFGPLHLPEPRSQSMPIEMQEDNWHSSNSHDCSLRAETPIRADLVQPGRLEVTDAESTKSPSKRDPSS